MNGSDRLGTDELRSRAASGAALLGARGVLIYTLGIAANLLLARLLAPRDFGLLALGTVLVGLGTYLATGGLGAALIRREEPPLRIELEAVVGAQLALTGVVTAAAVAGSAPFGRDGLVVATMVASLPLVSFRTPSVIVLERRLQYRLIATADVAEALAYYLWAVGAVAIGFGVWGLATAVVVRAAVGSGVMIVTGPSGLVRPRWSLVHLRPLLAFGVRYQASGALMVLRQQGLNVVVAVVAGISTLGVWNLASRVLQVPNLLFLTVARVAFPALSRFLGAGQDVRPVLERGVAALGAMTGFAAGAFVGFAPALPSLIGHRWHAVPAVLLWSGVALIVSAPASVACAGYLLAADEVGTVVTATAASTVAWFGLAAGLLPSVGAPAVAIGWVAAGAVNTGFLWRRTTVLTRASIASHLAFPTVASLAATAAGWMVARQAGGTVLGGCLGVATAEVALVLGLALTHRAALADTWSLSRQGIASFRAVRGSKAAGSTSTAPS